MSARSDAMHAAAAIADGVAVERSILSKVLTVEAAQAERAGERDLADALHHRSQWRADEAEGARRAAHAIALAAIDAYYEADR